jgi:hypothetical protein
VQLNQVKPPFLCIGVHSELWFSQFSTLAPCVPLVTSICSSFAKTLYARSLQVIVNWNQARVRSQLILLNNCWSFFCVIITLESTFHGSYMAYSCCYVRYACFGYVWFLPYLALPNVGKNWLASFLAKESSTRTWPIIWQESVREIEGHSLVAKYSATNRA